MAHKGWLHKEMEQKNGAPFMRLSWPKLFQSQCDRIHDTITIGCTTLGDIDDNGVISILIYVFVWDEDSEDWMDQAAL